MELCIFGWIFFIDLPFIDLPFVPFFVSAGVKLGIDGPFLVGAVVGGFNGSASSFVGVEVGIVVLRVEDGCAVGWSVAVDGGEVGLEVLGVNTGL
jgi:hypothetical protein